MINSFFVAYNESTDDEDQNELDNAQIITESSEMHVIEAVVNEERPHTPELCLTGVAMTKQETGQEQCQRIYYQNSRIRHFGC